jgi:hypothetical protein
MTAQPLELWAFLENSDFQRRKAGKLYRQDEVRLIRHDELLEVDYQLMVDIGCVGIRDAARWYITHPAQDTFEWSWLDRVIAAAQQFNLTLYLDLWHYGYPDWLDIMSADAPRHFANFAAQIATRYPTITHYCVSNEPSLLVDYGGRKGRWRPFFRRRDPSEFRRQICRMIMAASQAILDIKPTAQLILPEPWHATTIISEDDQAAVLDTVMGLRDADLGVVIQNTSPSLVSIITAIQPCRRFISSSSTLASAGRISRCGSPKHLVRQSAGSKPNGSGGCWPRLVWRTSKEPIFPSLPGRPRFRCMIGWMKPAISPTESG